jgi:4-hydroxy-tetrahydrodipicolinate synthase
VTGRVCREHGASFTVGVFAAGTRRAVRELEALAALPVPPDAALVTVPPFVRPGEAGVLAHFRTLVAATSIPLLAYHVPHRTAQPLGAETLLALAAIPGVAGMKYAPGVLDADTAALLGAPAPAAGEDGLDRDAGVGGHDRSGAGAGGALARAAGDRTAVEVGAAQDPGDRGVFGRPGRFTVLAGDDALAPALLALGAHGGILASAHLATRQWVRLAADPLAPHARTLGHRLAGLANAVFSEPNPTVLKAVLHAQGRIPTPDVRLPLLPATAAGRDATLTALSALAALDGGTTPS